MNGAFWFCYFLVIAIIAVPTMIHKWLEVTPL